MYRINKKLLVALVVCGKLTRTLFSVCFLTLLVSLFLLKSSEVRAQSQIIDLGTLGGNSSQAFGINKRGQVVGASRTTSGELHAFLWEKGIMIDLGTLGGNNSNAYAINDSGQIVGESTTASGQGHAFLWEKGVMIDLEPGFSDSAAYAINDSGMVVGRSETDHPFLWRKGVLTDLGFVGTAFGINKAGQVVGVVGIGGERPTGHAFLWENGVMTDLGTLGGDYIYALARAINKDGLVAGWSTTASGQEHACLWIR